MSALVTIRGWTWTLRRFGLTPDKWCRRLFPSDGPRVLCISIPKAGTHLLERALCLWPSLYRKLLPTLHPGNIDRHGGLTSVLSRCRPNQILVTHLIYSPEAAAAVQSSGVRTILVQRDPRDLLISRVFYIAANQRHHLHDTYAALPDVKSRILLDIKGDGTPAVPSLRRKLECFTGWLDTDCLKVRFEDLIGAKGNGDASTQQEILRRIMAHLGLEADEAWTISAAADLHDTASPTFRKGTIGQWRAHFDDEISALFHEYAGPVMRRLGYEEE